jgi:hypothetical protein
MAGKGRTGTVIGSFLSSLGLFEKYQDALKYYSKKRNVSVTQPAQVRYVEYFERLMKLDPANNFSSTLAPILTNHQGLKTQVGVVFDQVLPDGDSEITADGARALAENVFGVLNLNFTDAEKESWGQSVAKTKITKECCVEGLLILLERKIAADAMEASGDPKVTAFKKTWKLEYSFFISN